MRFNIEMDHRLRYVLPISIPTKTGRDPVFKADILLLQHQESNAGEEESEDEGEAFDVETKELAQEERDTGS